MSLPQKTRRAALEKVWTLVRDTHWDPALVGASWAAARKKFLPRALAAPSDEAFWGVLQEMLDTLGQSHFAILPPGAYTGSEAGSGRRRSGGGFCGARLSLSEGQVLIASVRAGSPAEEAGLKPGWRVSGIGGQKVSATLNPLLSRKARAVDLGLALRALAGVGSPGESVPWVVEDGKTVAVRYAEPPGQVVQQLGLPPVPVESESKRLDGGAWYFRFNIFLVLNMEAFVAALSENQDAPGLILDLRGNPGGLSSITWGIASRVALWPGILGKQKMRGSTLVFPVLILDDDPKPFRGPVAVLTDELSLSCSEVLAGGLQELGRARVFGRTTGGMVLPALISQLPGGARLEHAVADFKTPRGVLLEGRGVVPDFPVVLTRKTLLEDSDPDLTAAQKWIAAKKVH